MAEEEQSINLKILSPSTEVEGGVNLPDLPASTTIKELRSRIQNAVPSKPATDRMRLIYRGRVVANDADTLGNVFGTESIRENKDHSLHLVLRELPTNGTSLADSGPRSSPAPLNPFRPAQAPAAVPASPLQTNPFRTLPPGVQPNSRAHTPQPHHHHHPHVHHHHHLPVQANPLPVPLPPQLQQHFAQAMAQQGQQNNGQQPNTQGGQTGGNAPAPANGAQPPLPGAIPLPPMGLPNLPGTGGQTVRQEGIGPNGARFTVTYNQINIPAHMRQPTAPFPLPPFPPLPTGPPLPSDSDSSHPLFPRIRRILQDTKQEMQNIQVLIQGHLGRLSTSNLSLITNIPLWRIQHIRPHLSTVMTNLDVIDRALGMLSVDANLPVLQSIELVALRRSATEIRTEAVELQQMLDRQHDNVPADQTSSSTAGASTANGPSIGASPTAPGAPIMTPAVPTTSQLQTQNAETTMPAGTPAELFLLSSPQGPVGILFDQQGTYTTAPMVSTLAFQTFTNQFAQNRQLIAGLGQRMAQSSYHLHNQEVQARANETQQQAASGAQPQAQDQHQAQVQPQDQNQNQQANGNANVNPPPAENDRVVNVGAHLWLIFKLACFVYFFSGGSDYYRPVMLGLIACIVYLAQIGIFEDQINLVRRHFEALLPTGAWAAPNQPNTARRNVTPEEAARRLLERRQGAGWIREAMRSVERAFALFVASLFPGVGERMVHAQEERERLERVAAREAEEERVRQEDEARRREEEKQDEPQAEGSGEEAASEKGKKKEKERAEGEASSSAQL